MDQKKFLTIVCCLTSVLGFGEETLKLPLKNINAASAEIEQSLDLPLEEMFADSNTDILQSGSKNHTLEEIVYPVEESNFEEVFGSNP
jgi:hypothetical protein